MTIENSLMHIGELPNIEFLQYLEQQFVDCKLHRERRIRSYEPGHIVDYDIMGTFPAHSGKIRLRVENFVGSGFAGQVYRVQCKDLICPGACVEGIEVGQTYALKILKPASTFSLFFRNTLYALAFQSHFLAQVNPASVRAGVLWQKFIREAARIKWGNALSVCDSYATLYDSVLHSFGEINEWIDGRIWKFEVDDQLFDRWAFQDSLPTNHNTPEYVSKKLFMRAMVELMHELGAGELARQYEWWTSKSQPNVLKRNIGDESPEQGLTAVDFRAGLALLAGLPMSPIDIVLIVRGLLRGRLVQFDQSEPGKFEKFIQQHKDELQGFEPALEELKEQDAVHQASRLNWSYHHVNLLTRPKLRQSIKKATITAWKNLAYIDSEKVERLNKKFLFFCFYFLLCFPVIGRLLLKLWGNRVYRRHMVRCVFSPSYLLCSMRGARIEKLICWHKQERLSQNRIVALIDKPFQYWYQRLVFGWLPAKWHRLATDTHFAWEKLKGTFLFAYWFLRISEFREKWLLEQVKLGQQEGMLDETEARRISNQVKDPYVQKYLKCLAVHVCTVPVTQITMVIVGIAATAYCLSYRNMSWMESVATGTAAGALIQLSPISPGSITRGLFVIYLMIKERDIRNYYIAAPVAFIHVIGYLAFPLQMVTHNPALARFMAGRWAKGLVHVIPVFGERGALLEHAVFDLFFNLPLSLKRSFRLRPVLWSMRFVYTIIMTVGLAFICYTEWIF